MTDQEFEYLQSFPVALVVLGAAGILLLGIVRVFAATRPAPRPMEPVFRIYEITGRICIVVGVLGGSAYLATLLYEWI